MSKTFDTVKEYIDSMSKDDIKGYDYYPMRTESIEHLRACFLSWLESKSLITWFFEDCILGEIKSELLKKRRLYYG